MLKIKPLVWEWEGNGSCYARTIVGNIYIDGVTEMWCLIAGGSVIGDFATLELAQAAAEEWYRAKMMEGLEEVE
jgi:hypothetical protein